MWRFWSCGVVHEFNKMADSSKSVDVGLFYLVDAVKGKKISIYLQIWTGKCVYIWNLTFTWSDTIRPCQNIHRHRNAPGGQILNFQNNEIRMKIQTENFFEILISTRLVQKMYMYCQVSHSIISLRLGFRRNFLLYLNPNFVTISVNDKGNLEIKNLPPRCLPMHILATNNWATCQNYPTKHQQHPQRTTNKYKTPPETFFHAHC